MAPWIRLMIALSVGVVTCACTPPPSQNQTSTSAPSPTVSRITPPASPLVSPPEAPSLLEGAFTAGERAMESRGEKVFEMMFRKEPRIGRYDVRGEGTLTPTITVYTTFALWGGLSGKDKVAVTYYAEGLARQNKSLCKQCWQIILGRPKGDTITVDKTVVRGDTYADREPDGFGERASVFRRRILGRGHP